MWKWYGKHIFITDVGKHNWIMNYLTNEIPFVSVGDRWKPIRVSSHKPSQNSLTFPDHFVFSPNQETCYRYYYCLNNNVASNLTNHSPKLPIYEVITIRQNVKNMKHKNHQIMSLFTQNRQCYVGRKWGTLTDLRADPVHRISQVMISKTLLQSMCNTFQNNNFIVYQWSSIWNVSNLPFKHFKNVWFWYHCRKWH